MNIRQSINAGLIGAGNVAIWHFWPELFWCNHYIGAAFIAVALVGLAFQKPSAEG